MIASMLILAFPFLAATTPPEPLQVFDSEREPIVSVTTTASDTDLQFNAVFPRPVKSYLKEEFDNLPLEFHIDADNNANTGNQDSPDARKGTEFVVIAVARVPRTGVKAEEVIVSRNSDNMMVKSNAKIHTDGNKMTVSVPLSDLKLKKGQKIRIAMVAEGQIAEQTLKP